MRAALFDRWRRRVEPRHDAPEANGESVETQTEEPRATAPAAEASASLEDEERGAREISLPDEEGARRLWRHIQRHIDRLVTERTRALTEQWERDRRELEEQSLAEADIAGEVRSLGEQMGQVGAHLKTRVDELRDALELKDGALRSLRAEVESLEGRCEELAASFAQQLASTEAALEALRRRGAEQIANARGSAEEARRSRDRLVDRLVELAVDVEGTLAKARPRVERATALSVSGGGSRSGFRWFHSRARRREERRRFESARSELAAAVALQEDRLSRLQTSLQSMTNEEGDPLRGAADELDRGTDEADGSRTSVAELRTSTPAR